MLMVPRLRMRPADAVRFAYGVALVVTPRRVASTVGVTLDGRAMATARILGLRHVTQAVVVGTRDTHRLRRLGCWVDRLHAGSMVLLAAWAPGRERAALTDAIMASLFATMGNPAPRVPAGRTKQEATTTPEGDLLDPPPPAHPFGVSVPEDDPDAGVLERRRRDARLQRAVYDAYLATKGGELADVRDALTRSVRSAGLRTPTNAWLTAAAVDIADGNIYVVNGPAMHDIGLQLPPHGPT
jgi:hypothetical protein